MALYSRIIWLLAAVCLCPLLLKAQSGELLQRPYKPDFRSGAVRDFFRDIRKQTGVSVSFSSSFIDTAYEASVPDSAETIGAVLQAVMADFEVTLSERGRRILIIPSGSARKPKDCAVSGYIRDGSNGEILIGASVYFPGLKLGATTNNYGFFSITIPAGEHTALVSYIGYRTDTVPGGCTEKQRWNIRLQPANTLQEVKIVSERNGSSVQGDHLHVTAADIYQTKTLLGSPDVLRTLQMTTGVQSGIDGSSSIMVRGGNPGQNLYLLDGVPLYYVDHLFGLTSVYNTDAVKSADFYKGAFPARYGGRLSSILDVHTRDGDMERTGGQFSMGLLTSTLNLEGPVVKNKASFMLSGRRTWLDGLIYPFVDQIGLNFYDFNGKANWIINKNNRVYVSYYTGRDQMRIREKDVGSFLRTRWGNSVTSLKWTSDITPRLFLNTTLTFSRFEYEIKDRAQVVDSTGIKDEGSYTGASTINEARAGVMAQWFPNNRHKVEIGGGYTRSFFEPTKLVRVDARIPMPANPVSNEFSSNEVSLFAEDEIRIGSRFILRPGLHWSSWFNHAFDYSGLQPRLYGAYRIRSGHTVHASVSRMVQFLHMIGNNSYGLPTDFWVPSTDRIVPEKAWVGSAGYSGRHKALRFNADVYYKHIDGVVVHTAGKNIFDNSHRWQDKILQGRGWSYGLELAGSYRKGKLQTSFAYTLSWNWRQFSGLNGGLPFPHRYDRRHNMKLSAGYDFRRGANVGINWTYMSGEAFTLPDQIYGDLDNNLLILQSSISSASYTYHYSKWNAYRLPDIHRLDAGFNFTRKKGDYLIRTWSFGVFNAYGRPNVMFVTLGQDDAGIFRLQRLSVMQFIPYITYKLQF